MQYLLTEEEFLSLTQKQCAQATAEKEKLQKFCTLAAQHIPVPTPWTEDKTPKPWGCILVPPSPGYCDDCPVSEICPHPYKEWSK